MEDITFEKAIIELEKIVKKLDKGNLSLEQNLELYEKGTRLAKYCSEALDKAQLKIEEIQMEKEQDVE